MDALGSGMTASIRRWAFASTVAGGALIVAGSALMMFFWLVLGGVGWAAHWWTPGHGEMLRTLSLPLGLFVLWGLVAGLLVLWSGVRMQPGGPGRGRWEGIVAIVASALSFPAMGGFMFGALLGVLGGALSLAASEDAPT